MHCQQGEGEGAHGHGVTLSERGAAPATDDGQQTEAAWDARARQRARWWRSEAQWACTPAVASIAPL